MERLPSDGMERTGLRVVSLNLGGRNTNPLEFDLKGDNSEMAHEAMSVLRSARKALLNIQEGPRLMPTAEVTLVKEILSEIYEGIECEWRARIESLFRCATWGDVISLVQENNTYFFNSLNLCTLKLQRPSVWEDPASCVSLRTVADYLIAWRQWFSSLDRAGKFWLEDAPRAAKKRGMDVATAFAGILVFDVMCVCTARCCHNAACARELAEDGEDEEEREVPFSALAKFASKLPASNLTARHTIAQKFTAGAHVVLAQEARSFAQHPAVVERFFPPFCALDGFTAVFLRKTSFVEATDISGLLAQKMADRIASSAPEDWRKAWRTTASRLAAVVCRCEPHLGGFRACFVSLHCCKSEGTAAFVEILRDVLADYDADINVVGMDANCAGTDVHTFQSRLRKLGFDLGCQQHLQQVTVAKQRTAFQTQVEKYGEIDISHKDYILSWVSPRVRRGPTSYTPDLRTAYGVEQETKQCMRLPTTLWPFDHCGVTTTFEQRLGCREKMRCSWSRSCSCALAALMIVVLSMPLFSKERASPYGHPGSWYYTSRRTTHRSGICEAVPPCAEGWVKFEESCYTTTARSNYQDAMQACEQLGATLTSIGSEVENDFITSTLCPEGEFCYIGLQGDFAGEEHAWLSGEAVNYTRLVPARKALLPLFPLSRRTTHQAAILSNLPGEVSGCEADLGVPFKQGIWNQGQAILPAIAILVSGCLLMLSRPSEQRFSTWLLRLALTKNIIWYVLRVWLMCFEADFRRHNSVFGVAIVLENATHSVTAMLTLWLIIRRLSMLYPSRMLRSIYTALVTFVVTSYVNAGLFVDNAADVGPSACVWAQSALTAAVTVLTMLLSGLISTDLYRAWTFMSKEAAVGLSSQGSTSLALGVRAAKFHFFSVLAATGTSVSRLAFLLWSLLVVLDGDYPMLVHAPLLAFFRFLDTVMNDVCVHLLAVLNVDASFIRAKGITAEVVERAGREVAQHRLSVRLLKAAPTSSEQLLELAELEEKARAALGTEQEKTQFLILQSAVRVEEARIHRLMQCVRMRSMTMPVRYQFLIDIPVLEGQPRQHVPKQFESEESGAAADRYFEWLYAEADATQEVFFSQVRQLLSSFNSTPWPTDLGLVQEELPWTIWAAGPRRVASRRLAGGDDISPGDILIHRPRKARCGLGRSSSALVVVLEEVSASRVRVHRSGSVSPEEVPRSELRTCNSGAVFVPGLQKKKQRCLDKIAADYEGCTPWPAAASLVDICRCTILLDDPYAIAVLVAHIRNRMHVVRLKNRFSEDVLDTRDPKELQSMFQMASASTGRSPSKGLESSSTTSTRCADDYQFRDISVNVATATPSGLPMICEIQLTLSSLAVLKHADQKLYSIRRMKSPSELRKAQVFATG